MRLSTVDLSDHQPERPIVVLGPSLGTSVTALWGTCAALLADHADVVGWELPGHGTGASVDAAFSVEDLADAVAGVVADLRATRGHVPVHYAGDSVGGAVGLALALRHPHLLTTATLACTGARIGT
ncbi:MAG: alpha/beta fold hydrolase, partial [Williamsia herbipolensis]|nr:alpha/beta fold hydrolase [Williamsia herbipolensis]